MSKAPTTITVHYLSDSEIIHKNITNLSRALGYRLNKSKLIKHVLKNCTSKKYLYDIGFISFREYNEDTIIKRSDIKLNNRKMKKND